MFSRQFAFGWVLLILGWVSVHAQRAQGGITFSPLGIVSQSVRIDGRQEDAIFSITFDRAPDFQQLDAEGRRADSFQYEIAPGFSRIDQASFFDISAVIRGDEIEGQRLPIRAGVADGSDSDPRSGGWGMKLGELPYSLTGEHLSFTTPLAWLRASEGVFAYRIFTTHFGSTASLESGSTAVPLPAAVWPGVGMLILIGIYSRSEPKPIKNFSPVSAPRTEAVQLLSPDPFPRSADR